MKFFLSSWLAAFFVTNALNAQILLIEAEDFQFKADWITTNYKGMGVVLTKGSQSKVATAVDIKDEGLYAVWASSADISGSSPGTRNYAVSINDTEMPELAGKHCRDGFYWEKLGEIKLPKGKAIINLQRKNSLPRADAIVLSKDLNANINKLIKNTAEREKYRVLPLTLKYEIQDKFPKITELKELPNPKKFTLENKKIRLSFTEKTDMQKTFFERSLEVFADSKWLKLPSFSEEFLFLIKDENPQMRSNLYYFSWTNSETKLNVNIDGKTVELAGSKSNPYGVGQIEIMRPSSVIKIDENTLDLLYQNGARARLSLPKDGYAVKFEIEKKVSESAAYSFGFAAFNHIDDASCSATLLPPLYQMRRTMSEPKAVTGGFTSHPLSIVEYDVGGKKFSNAVIADTDSIPFEWTNSEKQYFGLSNVNKFNQIQPVIFTPVLGGANSKLKSGSTLKASWYVMTIPDTWENALKAANYEVFKTDWLREAYETSLSDAAANMAIFLKNAKASAWAEQLKGRYNIESFMTVSQASPLAEISIALLTDDEEYYKTFALPTIEFTLSRQSTHFAAKPDPDSGFLTQKMTTLEVPNPYFDAGYYASVNKLLGLSNKWLREFYKNPDGSTRVLKTGRGDEWMSLLGIYFAEPTPTLLAEIKTKCDAYLIKAFGTPIKGEFLEQFSNVAPIPYWWYLPDIYEITKDEKYLHYARLGAFHSMSQSWAYPTPPANEEIVISKNNLTRGVAHIWWLGDKPFRLGSELNNIAVKNLKDSEKSLSTAEAAAIGGGGKSWIIPESKADARKVCEIGLSIEGPATYINGYDNYGHIIMCSWAPEMLRVAMHSNEDILYKFSRHSMIGRFANFPGYYIKDYQVLTQDETYPYKGPDITSFYYHQAPAFFAQTFEYLMTQAEAATKGKVKFPYVKQQGYVWFIDRIYGAGVGKFFDADAVVKLDKTAVRVNSPKINIVNARGADAIYSLLINDSASPKKVLIDFDLTSKLMSEANLDSLISFLDADGNKIKESPMRGDKRIEIPALSAVALKIPANKKDIYSKPPELENGHFMQKGLGVWEDLHIFRIRSAFGKDSIYAVATGKPKGRAKISIVFSSPSIANLAKASFPYELSLYPIKFEEKLSFKVILECEGQNKYEIDVKDF